MGHCCGSDFKFSFFCVVCIHRFSEEYRYVLANVKYKKCTIDPFAAFQSPVLLRTESVSAAAYLPKELRNAEKFITH